MRSWEVTEGEVTARVTLADGAVLLSVERRWRTVLPPSPVGLVVDGTDLGAGVTVLSAGTRAVRESYRMRTGKRTGQRRVAHQELGLRLAARDGVVFGLVVRAAADGVAFRHVLPVTGAEVRVTLDRTVYRLPDASPCWMLDYTTWYESPRFASTLGELAAGDYGYPALVRVGDGYVLLTESDVDGRFCGGYLRRGPTGGLEAALADAEVTVPAGAATPWRVVVAGSLATVFASTLVDDLAPPARAGLDTAHWIRPGRAVWSWWSGNFSGAYADVQRRWVGYAAARGFEHVLVDCGWDPAWVPELVAYASRRGVQVHLWTAWDALADADGRARLALWRSWGVAGVKVDFMESESQERYRWYDAVLAETARLGLMVNFHGSVIPRGWQRTWPHVMTCEAVRGAEYYSFYGDPLSPRHNVIQPFTRNVVGSMDYTPVTFSATGRRTSDGHELALAVAFESGIQHLADAVDRYAERPDAERVLEQVPATWDESRLVSGDPDSHAVVARRSGARWVVGAITAGPPRTLAVALDFLDPGDWTLALTRDAETGQAGEDACATGLVTDSAPVDAAAVLAVPVARDGGFVAVLSRPGTPAVPRGPDPLDADAVRLEPPVQPGPPGARVRVVLRTPEHAHTTVLLVPPGWEDPQRDGATAAPGGGLETAWTVHVPADLPAGQLGIVTAQVRMPGRAIPVLAHARVVAPLAPGVTSVSALPFLAATNGLGPVERDLSNGGGDPRDGGPLTVAGVRYGHGLGVSAPSSVAVFVGGTAARLTALVGVDDEAGGSGAAVFEVWADDLLAATAGPVRGGEPAVALEADVRGSAVIRLVTRGEGAADAHGNWAEASLHRPGTAAEARGPSAGPGRQSP